MSLLSVGWHHRVPASCTFVCERQIKDRLFIERLPDQLQPNGKAVCKTTRHGNCTQTEVVDQTGRQSGGRLRHILYFWGRIQGGRRQYRIQYRSIFDQVLATTNQGTLILQCGSRHPSFCHRPHHPSIRFFGQSLPSEISLRKIFNLTSNGSREDQGQPSNSRTSKRQNESTLRKNCQKRQGLPFKIFCTFI